jgi:glycerol uptake facilitator-like aquaporin
VQHPKARSWRNPSIRTLVRNFVIEMVIYAVLVVGYFYLALRLLGNPLKHLFTENLVLYAFVALILIVAQGILLEVLTSTIVNWLKLERLE